MDDRKRATLREIDALVDVFASMRAEADGVALADWLVKIRAHVVADELEAQRLRAEIMLSARVPVIVETEAIRAVGKLVVTRREARKGMVPA